MPASAQFFLLTSCPQDLREFLRQPPFNLTSADLALTRFFVNAGEIYDFTYEDLVQSGDCMDYGVPKDPVSLVTPRLVEAVPVRSHLVTSSSPHVAGHHNAAR